MQSWAFFNFCQNCQKIGVKWHFSCKIDKKFFSNFSTWEKMPGRKSKFPGRFLVIWKSWSVNWSFLGISCLVAKLVVFGKFLVVFEIFNLATLKNRPWPRERRLDTLSRQPSYSFSTSRVSSLNQILTQKTFVIFTIFSRWSSLFWCVFLAFL